MIRIISQSGRFDFPYESSVVTISQETIFVRTPGLEDEWTIAAMYSTTTKAQKAIEMLHNAATGIFYARNIEFDEENSNELINMMQGKELGIITVSRDSRDIEFKPANIVFRFPKDDEI